MLATKDAIATVAVSDLPTATKFYEETLGLQRAAGSPPEPPVYQAGKFRLLVYQSKYAGTNQATAFNPGRLGDTVVRGAEGRTLHSARPADRAGAEDKGRDVRAL